MSLEKVLSISSKPGLYELKAQTRSGFVAQSLESGKKIAVNLQHDVSMLSEITVYTQVDEMPLAEIFEKIYAEEDGKKTIDHKKPKDQLVAHFKEIIPEYDENRVYGSDIKKMFQWYNILIDNGFESFSKEEKETKSDEEE